MNKAYSRIDWENYPSSNTPINESNLNKMDAALDEVDNRLIAHDTEKASKIEVATLVADVRFDESTGIITVTKKNGSVITIDTKMEKIAVNFDYNSDTQQIILTLIDGTKQYIDLSALITQYEFLNSDTITFVVQADGSIKAEVLDGSITDNKIEGGYLAQIKVETAKSESYMNSASQSATSANNSANLSKSYAVGGTGTRENEDTDNAMYYYEQAKQTDIGQISSKVDEINSNLDALEYSEIAGGKNFANINDFKVLTSNPSRYGYEWLSMKGGTYTFNVTNGNNTLYIGYKHNGEIVNPGSVRNGSKVQTITISDGDDILIWYEAGVTENTVTELQLEEGNVATPYEPYIPSVKMLADEVNQQNESLDEQGLLNKFDGQYKQGVYSTSNGTWMNLDIAVSNKNKIYCKSGDIIDLKYFSSVRYLYIEFFNGDDEFISSKVAADNANTLREIAPENTSYIRFGIELASVLTPDTAGKTIVYINNAIDEIKNDLSGNDKVVVPLLNSCTGELYYNKIGGLIVVNGVVNIPKANENVKVATLPNSKVSQGNAFIIYNFTDDTHDSEYATRYASDSSLVVKVPIANKDYVISGCYIGN